MASLIFRSAGILSVFLLIFACAADNPGAVNSFDGTPIKFEVAGAGDVTLVFVSGWGGNRKDWFRQVEYFSPKYRVVTVDPAGFGESGSSRQDWTIPNFGRDVTAVIEELDAEVTRLRWQALTLLFLPSKLLETTHTRLLYRGRVNN